MSLLDLIEAIGKPLTELEKFVDEHIDEILLINKMPNDSEFTGVLFNTSVIEINCIAYSGQHYYFTMKMSEFIDFIKSKENDNDSHTNND